METGQPDPDVFGAIARHFLVHVHSSEGVGYTELLSLAVLLPHLDAAEIIRWERVRPLSMGC